MLVKNSKDVRYLAIRKPHKLLVIIVDSIALSDRATIPFGPILVNEIVLDAIKKSFDHILYLCKI